MNARASVVVCLLISAVAASISPASETQRTFRPAEPGWRFEFPRDHGSHPEFLMEWWYYTGHLQTESGRDLGFELTFFRVGTDVPDTDLGTAWDLRDLYLAHFALTLPEEGEFRYYEKLNRSSPFLADARVGELGVFNEDWEVSTLADGAVRLQASASGDAIDLRLRTTKAPAIHGREGISVKAEGKGFASHYYSLSRIEVSGVVISKGRRESCEGTAWMDHEFGSATLREYQQGWDWFSIQLDNNNEIMLYVIRRADGTADVTSSGSLILADGSVIHLNRDDFSITTKRTWKSPKSGAVYPLDWQVRIDPFDVRIRVVPVMDDQELVTSRSTRVTYWEGAVEVSGRFGGTTVRGLGYVEMTGYDEAFKAKP